MLVQPLSDTLSISAIVPVYNGCDFLARSVPPLVAMLRRGDLTEVIVVDDGSTDQSAARAIALGAHVMDSGGRLGPGGARNRAARIARGAVLWFVDADVVVHDDAVTHLRSALSEPAVTAVFGAYDDAPPAKNFFSRYKNLVHHFYHVHARPEASTFWAGCGAVRTAAFLAVGGFDEASYRVPSIEDIELGYRLRAAGARIRMCSKLRGTHLKTWRFMDLVRVDVFRRALPWARLMLARGELTDDLNVGMAERMRAVAAWMFFAGLAASLHPAAPAWTVLLLLGGISAVNARLLHLFYRRGGTLFAIGGLLFQQVYYLYSSAAFAWCWLEASIEGVRRG